MSGQMSKTNTNRVHTSLVFSTNIPLIKSSAVSELRHKLHLQVTLSVLACSLTVCSYVFPQGLPQVLRRISSVLCGSWCCTMLRTGASGRDSSSGKTFGRCGRRSPCRSRRVPHCSSSFRIDSTDLLSHRVP